MLEERRQDLGDPAQVLCRLNRGLMTMLSQPEQFTLVSAACLVFDLRLGRAAYANAGHPPPYAIQGANGSVSPLGPDMDGVGPALGIDPAPGKDRYEATYRDYLEKYGEDNAEYLMEMEQAWFREYSTAAYIDCGVGNTEAYEAYTKECADWLKWRFDRLDGDAALIKRFVNGPWDSDDFLIVEPHHKIEGTNDEQVIRSVSVNG
jgi:hypothetical protein